MQTPAAKPLFLLKLRESANMDNCDPVNNLFATKRAKSLITLIWYYSKTYVATMHSISNKPLPVHIDMTGLRREKTCPWVSNRVRLKLATTATKTLDCWNFACIKSNYYSFHILNNKCADQTARMRRLVCTLVGLPQQSEIFRENRSKHWRMMIYCESSMPSYCTF